MAETLRPDDATQVREIVSAAGSRGERIRVRGGGSKGGFGAPTSDATILDMRGISGVIDYDPPELVLTLHAGTSLAEVQALVAAQHQMLAFDPFDTSAGGGSTIGGVVAAGVAGPARLTRGATRDHVLGFEAVSGRGERFVAGGKVVKNVTGYDLPKLITGSWGRLAAITQVTLKVMPRPHMQSTLLLRGLDVRRGVAAMARALGAPVDLSAAAHLADWHGEAVTALRLDGFPPSVSARSQTLAALLDDMGNLDAISADHGDALWDAVRHVSPLPIDCPLWRVVVPPSAAPDIVAAVPDAAWMLDWAGGLIWLASRGDPLTIRRLAEAGGGHASLVRADAAMRATVPALHPQPAPVAALEARVRRAFDPAGVFETGRF
jgi:glycolate oxidase FAD binding subunit